MKKSNEIKLVEIARSFSVKCNLGNYESADFFCSQKMEVPENEAKRASAMLFEFCKEEVLNSAGQFIEERKKNIDESTNLPIIRRDESTGSPVIQQEGSSPEKPQPRIKYGKDNCGCRFGATCDSHKAEYIIDAEQFDKQTPRIKSEEELAMDKL